MPSSSVTPPQPEELAKSLIWIMLGIHPEQRQLEQAYAGEILPKRFQTNPTNPRFTFESPSSGRKRLPAFSLSARCSSA
eukprot:1409374-Pyramimonas_sp.AAC.1